MSNKRAIQIPRQKKGPNGEKLCRWCEGLVLPPRRTFCSQDCVDEALIRSTPSYARAKVRERDKGVCQICETDTAALKRRYHQLVAFSRQGILAYERTIKKAARRTGLEPEAVTAILAGGLTAEEVENKVWRERTQQIDSFRRTIERSSISYSWNCHPDDPRYAGVFQSRMREIASQLIPAGPRTDRIRAIDTRLRRLAEAARAALQSDLQARRFDEIGDIRIMKSLWQADHVRPVEHGGGGCGLDNLQTLCTPCHKEKTRDQARRRALIRRGIDPDAPDPQPTLL